MITNKKQPLLESLKTKRTQLNARIQKLESAEKTRERKKETRRKILVGAYYLERIRQENKMATLIEKLNEFLTRNSDRVLFDLPVLDHNKNKAVAGNENPKVVPVEEVLVDKS